MKIGIIGFGFVGQAIGWAYRDYNMVIRDPKMKDSASLDKFSDCDAIFVCVPSPSTDDGHCDSSILKSVLKELLFVNINKQIPIICKTTAPPAVYKELQQQYPNLVHVPEFLTASNAVRDYANADYCVIGGDYDWAVKARKIIQAARPLTEDKHIIVGIETAALYKYMMNSYLATKVTFMNDFKKLADSQKVDWNDLKFLAGHDSRIGITHMDVPGPDGEYGWGGACFPKDVAAIIMEAIDNNIDFELMDRVESINKKHRKNND
jgi:nucleotide sugar dehydrogenase